MNSGTIQYGIAGCILALAVAVIYAIVRLHVLSQRVDWSILIVNVIAFAAISGVLIYLTKKYEEQSWPSYNKDSWCISITWSGPAPANSQIAASADYYLSIICIVTRNNYFSKILSTHSSESCDIVDIAIINLT
jgi:hypothetical protein